jgi:hypothetical protein
LGGELRSHVHHHSDAIGIQAPPFSQEPGRVRVPQAHIGFVGTRRDFPYERRTCSDCDGKRSSGIPQEIYSERTISRSQRSNDLGHHSNALIASAERVWPVSFVAEHNCIYVGGEQDLKVSRYGVD